MGSVWIIIACALWSMDTLIRYPLMQKGVSSLDLVLIEHILLSLIFFPFIIRRWRQLGELNFNHLFAFLMVGVFGSAIATWAFTQSFNFLSPSLVILLQKLQTVVAILGARLILKEPISKNFIKWAFVIFIGGILVSFDNLNILYHQLFPLDSFSWSENLNLGLILVSISVIGWGLATVYGKYLTIKGYSQTQILSGRFIFALMALLLIKQSSFKGLILNDSWDYLRILIMVLISGAIAMWFYYKGLKTVSASNGALSEMFFPFFAVIVNWLFFKIELNWLQMLGGALLIMGSIMIQVKKY